MCPLCQGRAGPFGCAEGAAFLRCTACGFLFRDPRCPAAGEVAYDAQYVAGRGDAVAGSGIARAKAATYGRYLALLRGDYGFRGGRLLEIGCSTGIGLRVAQQAGLEVYGLDVSAAATQHAARAVPGAVVRTGTLADSSFEPASFEHVLMLDTIEHCADPAAVMERVAQLLKPGGACLIVTPDTGSFSFRLLKLRWPHFLAEHVSLFSRRSLRRLCERSGLFVRREGNAGKFVTLDMLLRHRARHPHAAPGLLDVLCRLAPQRLKDAVVSFNIGETYVIAEKRT